MAKKKPAAAAGDQKLYRNTGVSSLVIDGVRIEPGAEFNASLTPEFEQQMFSGGHLILVKDQSTRADRAQARAAEEYPSTGPVLIPKNNE